MIISGLITDMLGQSAFIGAPVETITAGNPRTLHPLTAQPEMGLPSGVEP